MNALVKMLKPVKRTVDRVFHILCRLVFSFDKRAPSDTILLVRTDGIGDLIYWGGYLKTIRERYRGWRLVLCAEEQSATLASTWEAIDDVVPFRRMACRRNYFYRLRILRRVRSLSPKTSLYLSFHREDIGDELTLLSGAGETIAFSGNDECIHPSMRIRNNREYSRILQVGDHLPEREKYAALMEAIGATTSAGSPDTERTDLMFRILQSIPADVARGVKSQRTVVLGPGGSGPIRRWPAAKFPKLADLIAGELNVAIVLVGDRREERLLRQIAAAMHKKAQLCFDRSIVEVASMIRSAVAFVGNESALLHLAASLGTPAVGILGGGHFRRYFPYGSVHIVNHRLDCYDCNWQCTFPQPYCITDITVDDVMNGLRTVLSHSTSP